MVFIYTFSVTAPVVSVERMSCAHSRFLSTCAICSLVQVQTGTLWRGFNAGPLQKSC